MDPEAMRTGIVGAGLAGLACAARLSSAGFPVQLFDKARGAGGRMSARRVDTPLGEVGFDHGAQYFTAHGAAFRSRVEQWAMDGIVAPWSAAGPDAWVGVPGMNAPVRALAAEQKVRWGCQVESLSREGPLWRLTGGGEDLGQFDAVILALPAEQATVLIGEHDPALAARAATSRTQPCWTVMAAFDQPLPIVAHVLRDEGQIGWAARNTSKPGRGPIEAWVVQGNPLWSQAHLEESGETICQALLAALQQHADGPIPRPIAIQAHRWRFARSAAGSEGALWSALTGLGCCGDWLISPRVESAWDSGQALADRVLAHARRG